MDKMFRIQNTVTIGLIYLFAKFSVTWQKNQLAGNKGGHPYPMRSKAKGTTQHGSPPGWLEENDPMRARFAEDDTD
jgi:hypothetical protein